MKHQAAQASAKHSRTAKHRRQKPARQKIHAAAKGAKGAKPRVAR